jgi:hypothetical protein
MSEIIRILVHQLEEQDNVLYRREVKELLKKLNFIYRDTILPNYYIELSEIAENKAEYNNWIKIY